MKRKPQTDPPQPKRDSSFCDLVLDQLSSIPELLCVRMFGGYGLYSGEAFFGIIAAGRLYFLTDEQSRKPYIERGMGAFLPSEREKLSNYFQVPVDVIEDAETLDAWARQALQVRHQNPVEKSRRKRKRPRT